MWKRRKFALYVDKYVTMWPENGDRLQLIPCDSHHHALNNVLFLHIKRSLDVQFSRWSHRAASPLRKNRKEGAASAGECCTSRCCSAFTVDMMAVVLFTMKVGHRAHTCTITLTKRPEGEKSNVF